MEDTKTFCTHIRGAKLTKTERKSIDMCKNQIADDIPG